MHHGRISHPCLAGVLEVVLHAAPFVPRQEAVEANQEQRDENENNNSDFGGLDKVPANVVDHGRVEVGAESETVLFGNGQTIGVERNTGKSVVDILFQQLERRVDAEGKVRKAVSNYKIVTYTASTLSLISWNEGMEAFSLVSASSKEAGRATFWRPSRLGTLISGAEMSPKGLTLLIPSMAVLMILFAEVISF